MSTTKWWCFIQRMLNWRTEMCTDDSGRESMAKNMLFFGWLAMTAFSAKLITTGGFGIEYFLAYGALITGHSNFSKWLDIKAGKVNKTDKE